MSNLRRFWQRLYDAWLDPKVDFFIILAALVGGSLYLWVYPPPMPHLVQRLLRLLFDIWEMRSDVFVIVIIVFVFCVSYLAKFFKRFERVGARRLGAAPKRTNADRIHLFAHRIGLVLAGILLIIAGIPLLLHMGTLAAGDVLLIIAIVSALLAVAYGIPRLIGWVIAALFE